MDTGKIGDNQVCSPQLLAFDLTTDNMIYRHRLNDTTYIGNSLFITPVSTSKSYSEFSTQVEVTPTTYFQYKSKRRHAL